EGQLPVSGAGALGRIGNTLWFGNSDDKSVERIDARTRKLVHPFVSIQDGIAGMAVGLGAGWVVDGTDPVLLRVDPRYLTIQRIPLPHVRRSDIDFTAPPRQPSARTRCGLRRRTRSSGSTRTR